MTDPHVQTLTFRLRTDETISYKDDAAPVTYETPTFKATLEKGVVSMSMKQHFATAGEAINAVMPDLRSWEILTGLQFGPGSFGFEFEGADVIDRNPPPASGQQVQFRLESGRIRIGGGPARFHVVRSQYPGPPKQFKADANVEVLWKRYARYRQGGEPLTGMGYFCLSVIQADAGGRQKAATKFAINVDLLHKLGELTSEAGDETEARKRDHGSTYLPLTEKQKTWINAAICVLIRRVGELAANPGVANPQITMSDLPSM
jgi:hypothetical protein